MAEDTRADGGPAVVALGLGALLLMIAGAAAALLADLPWGQVLVVALLVPMSISTLVGLTVLAVATARRGARGAETPDDDEARTPVDGLLPERAAAPAAWSPQRRAAQRDLVRCGDRLERAVEVDPQAPNLASLVLELHEARLRLARVVLAEDGALSSEMADELLVAHRGVSALLRSSACAPDRRDA